MAAKGVGSFLAVVALLCASHTACAHPMGNFSVNHYSRIELKDTKIVVDYFIDLAEIPTYQELQEGSITASPNDPAVSRFITEKGATLGAGLILSLDGKRLPLHLVSSGVIFPPGAGGLPTMKMGFVYESTYPQNASLRHVSLYYADNNYQAHAGWKEIIAVAAGAILLRSSVPATDRSAQLSNYPTDLLNSPPQTLEASLEAELPALQPATSPAAPLRTTSTTVLAPRAARVVSLTKLKSAKVAALPVVHAPQAASAPSTAAPQINLVANRQQTPHSRFTELITAQNLGFWFLLSAAIIAMGLGALHALEPGHGKTIVAAYLVGSRGTARHAAMLGAIVTLSHTASVFALGAITLYASRYIVPEQLYPWLGAFSGIMIAGLGTYMFLRRWTGTATDHSHAEGGSHNHWFFWRRSANESAESAPTSPASPAAPVTLTQLFTLGITGGIVPCPAALVVLLSAFALHRIALGFFLIVAFSLGLAAVLIAFGMFMVYARRFMSRIQIDGSITKRWLPLASSAFITVLGLILTKQALSAVHFSLISIAGDKIGPALFVIGLGLVLGMRHSTDADHVVAISTIVTKQRSIRNAALIGSVWGLGHTITIFAVGALIILFGVEIPPRLGLSMEFCVAIMLVVLGLLNLSGVMQRITTYFTPARSQPAAQDAISADGTLPLGNISRKGIARLGLYQWIRPLVIGLVHGLAGSAAVALLVLSTIHNPVWATIYLLIFGGGTMIGMMVMTAAIAAPFAFAGDRFTKMGRYFGMASGMASLCFGSFLVYQLGFLGGLFTSHPMWTPR